MLNNVKGGLAGLELRSRSRKSAFLSPLNPPTTLSRLRRKLVVFYD